LPATLLLMAVFHLFLALLALMAAGKADEEVHKQSFKREQLGVSGQQVTRRLDRLALPLDKSVGEVVFKRNSSEVIGRQGRASKSRPSRQSCTAKTGMSFTRYQSARTITAFVECLSRQNPGRATLINIGTSTEGRKLNVLRLSSGRGKPAIFIDGGIHAREWISPATATYLAKQLSEKKSALLAAFDVYILPLANPDGYEYSRTKDRLWRKTRSTPRLGRCAGVDLNRNFGYKWGGKGSSKKHCSEVYRGPRAFSEPESRALRDFILARRKDIKMYLTLHSYGQMILYPWGYDSNVFAKDRSDLHSLGVIGARAMGRKYDVGPAATVNYEAAGASDDWAKGSAGIKYSYTVELPDSLNGKHRFMLPASYILRTGREVQRSLKAMGQALKKRL